MLPLTVCPENAVEIVPDWRRRVLEGEARKFADNGLPLRTRFKTGATYYEQAYKAHEREVWHAAYWKRIARRRRLGQPLPKEVYPCFR